MATQSTTVQNLRPGDVILPPARELSLWMRRTAHERGLTEDALRLTVTEIRDGQPDKRGRWLIIKTEQDPRWWSGTTATPRPFTFKARPETTWPKVTA